MLGFIHHDAWWLVVLSMLVWCWLLSFLLSSFLLNLSLLLSNLFFHQFMSLHGFLDLLLPLILFFFDLFVLFMSFFLFLLGHHFYHLSIAFLYLFPSVLFHFLILLIDLFGIIIVHQPSNQKLSWLILSLLPWLFPLFLARLQIGFLLSQIFCYRIDSHFILILHLFKLII